MSNRPLGPDSERPFSEADALLVQSRRLRGRSASDREATWRRLETVLDGPARAKATVAIRWPRLGFAVAAIATAVWLAVVWVPGRSGRNGQPRPVLQARTDAPDTPKAPGRMEPAAAAGGWRTGWREQDLGSNGHLIAEPQAQFRLPTEPSTSAASYVIALDQGEICVQVAHRDPSSQGPFVVETQQLRAVAVGTRFCVFAGSDAATSWVLVEEGRVRVERPSGESRLAEVGMVVNAAEIQTPALHPIPAIAAPSPLPVRAPAGPATSCPTAPHARREACLWRQASRSGLGSQNALYLLGVEADREQQPGRALAIWREYLRRFPEGVLVAEASFNAFEDLVAEKRFPEAVVAAGDLLEHRAGFVRAGEVRLQRAGLLMNELGRPQEARAEYERVLVGESRDLVRDDALYGLGLCEERLADGAAQATWEAYLREFPAGRHRSEVLAHRH